MNKKISFKHCLINLAYRDDSDLSVIDEFFVDKMYKSVEPIISAAKFPIIDIGAHIGVFSIYSKILNQSPIQSGTKIIAIEPHPDNFKLLKQNINVNNLSGIKIQQAAITSTEEKTAQLYLSKNSHNHSTTSLRGSARGGDEAISSPITVPAINLAQLIKENKIKKIGLLKMDIEGAEFEIIQNMEHACLPARQGTWNKIQYMVVEYHESRGNKRVDLENLIRSHGFSVEHFPNKFDKRFGLLVCRNKKSSK